MIKTLFLITSLFFFFFSASAFAKELKVVELIDLALTHRPETKKSWWNAKRAAASLKLASSAYLPSANLSTQFANGRDFKFLNGPNVDYTIAEADLTLTLLLYDFGERDAQVEAAKMALTAANWQTDWTMQKVLVEVLTNAYTTLNSQEMLRAAETALEDAHNMFEIAKQLNQAGLTPITDVYTSRSQLVQAQMELIEKQNHLVIQKARLISSLGLQAEETLAIAPITDCPQQKVSELNQLLTLAQQKRADLLAKRARVAEMRALHLKTKRAYRPKLTLTTGAGANYAFKDQTNGGQYLIKLNFDVPLFDGFAHTYRNRLAYTDLKATIEELAEAEINLSFEVFSYYSNLQSLQKTLPLAEEGLKTSQLAYEGALKSYGAGKENIAVVSNALLQLAAARNRFSDVKTRLLVAAANLAFSTGTLLPYLESSCETTSS